MFESGAILQYLLSQHNADGFQPEPADSDFPKYLQWAFFAEPSLGIPAGLIKLQTFLLPEGQRNPKVIDRPPLHSYASYAAVVCSSWSISVVLTDSSVPASYL